MYSYRIILLLVLLTTSSISFSQVNQSGIGGVVKTEPNEAAVNADIFLQGTTRGTTTDSSGRFIIMNLSPGKYVIKVTYLGYSPYETEAEVTEGKITYLDEIVLTPSQHELPEVLVTDSKQGKFNNSESNYILKLPVRNIEIPKVYSTSTRAILNEQNIIDISSAVRTVPGGNMTSENSIGVLGTIVRGFNTVAYIRNGLYSLNPNGGDLQNIERVELIKGPSGVLYGTLGVSNGGLLNIVTKKPLKTKYINTGITLGSFNQQRYAADINIPVNEAEGLLFRFNGAVTSGGTFQDLIHKNGYLLAPAISYNINENARLFFEADINSMSSTPTTTFNGAGKLKVNSIDRIKTDYFRSYSTDGVDNPPNLARNYQGKLDVDFSDNLAYTLGISLADFSLNGTVILLNLESESVLTRQFYDYHGQYNTINIQQNLTGNFNTFGLKNLFVAGIDYKRAEAVVGGGIVMKADSVDYTSHVNPVMNIEKLRSSYDITISRNEKEEVYSAYFSDFISITSKLKAIAGLRYEYLNYRGNKDLKSNNMLAVPFSQGSLVPQAGLSYQVIDSSFSLFTNFLEGYEYVLPNSQGQTFKPEYSSQGEAGIKTRLFNGRISSTISYYYILVRDKVRPDRTNPLLSVQDGSQKSEGIDADIRLNPVSGLNMILGYSFNKSVLVKASELVEGKRPPGTPGNILNLWMSYSFNHIVKGLGIGAGLTYNDKFFYDDLNMLTIPSSARMKASIFYNAAYFRVTLAMNNITDRRYWDVNGNPQPPRSLSFSTSLIF